MTHHRGQISGKGKSFALIVSRFNEFITRRLLDGAVEMLEQSGVSSRTIQIFWAPGALEIPYLCRRAAKTGRFHGLIAIACVLRGETFHYECVSHEVTRGISQAALETQVPIASAVITADTLEQAIDRAGLKAGNKGAHAALAALEMASLDQIISSFSAAGGKKK